MARVPNPKDAQADGVLDDAAQDAPAVPAVPAATQATDPGPPVPVMIRVSALQPSRWRIGRAFTPEPVLIDANSLTEAEIATLRADPLLSVVKVPDSPDV